MSEAKVITTIRNLNPLLVALVATLGVWLVTIVTALFQGGAISATPIVCWWVCWVLACVATSNLDQRRAAGGGQ